MAAGSKPTAELRRAQRWNKRSARLGGWFRSLGWHTAFHGNRRRATFNRKYGFAAINRKRRHTTFHGKHGFPTVDRKRRYTAFNRVSASQPVRFCGKL